MDYEAYDWFAWSKWLNTVASSTWNNELGEVQGIYSNCHEVMLQGVASVVQWYFGLSENALLVDHKLYGLPQLSKFLFVPMVSSSLVVRNSQLINATWGIHSCKPSSDFKVCPLQHFVIIPRYTAEDVVFGAHGSYPSDVSSKLWQKRIHFYSFNTTVIDRDSVPVLQQLSQSNLVEQRFTHCSISLVDKFTITCGAVHWETVEQWSCCLPLGKFLISVYQKNLSHLNEPRLHIFWQQKYLLELLCLTHSSVYTKGTTNALPQVHTQRLSSLAEYYNSFAQSMSLLEYYLLLLLLMMLAVYGLSLAGGDNASIQLIMTVVAASALQFREDGSVDVEAGEVGSAVQEHSTNEHINLFEKPPWPYEIGLGTSRLSRRG
jgi:hypothetical protein